MTVYLRVYNCMEAVGRSGMYVRRLVQCGDEEWSSKAVAVRDQLM